MRDASDDDILEYATRESRVFITLDPDFHHILTLTLAMRPSVVLIRQPWLRAAEVAPLVASICKEYETALSEGCVLLRGVS
jgi:predicted nuclease of predicted toxin-antitoxin system